MKLLIFNVQTKLYFTYWGAGFPNSTGVFFPIKARTLSASTFAYN